jgi:hypothetical protein
MLSRAISCSRGDDPLGRYLGSSCNWQTNRGRVTQLRARSAHFSTKMQGYSSARLKACFACFSIYFLKVYGGEGGIRTPDRVTPMPDFESGAFNRALPPLRFIYYDTSRGKRWGPAAGDPWREAAATAMRCLISRSGTTTSSKTTAAMRLRILSLTVSTPRWQTPGLFRVNSR